MTDQGEEPVVILTVDRLLEISKHANNNTRSWLNLAVRSIDRENGVSHRCLVIDLIEHVGADTELVFELREAVRGAEVPIVRATHKLRDVFELLPRLNDFLGTELRAE